MQVIAMMANRRRPRVLTKMPNIRPKLSLRRSPARMAARKQPVPVAVSQLKSKRAASVVGLAATGIVRETFPWSQGQSQPAGPGRGLPSAITTLNEGVVASLRAFLIEGSPQHRTKMDKITKGIHAFAVCPAEYCLL